mgnify:FL=1
MKRKQQFIAIAIIIIIVTIVIVLNGRHETTKDSVVNSAQEITEDFVSTPVPVLTASPTPVPVEITVTPVPTISPILATMEKMTGESETKTAEESNKTAEQEDRHENPQAITTEDGEVIISPGDAESRKDSSEKSQQVNPQQESGNDFSDGSIELPMVVIGE